MLREHLPLLWPSGPRRIRHSSICPKDENIILTSFSPYFFETIPTKSFLSSTAVDGRKENGHRHTSSPSVVSHIPVVPTSEENSRLGFLPSFQLIPYTSLNALLQNKTESIHRGGLGLKPHGPSFQKSHEKLEPAHQGQRFQSSMQSSWIQFLLSGCDFWWWRSKHSCNMLLTPAEGVRTFLGKASSFSTQGCHVQQNKPSTCKGYNPLHSKSFLNKLEHKIVCLKAVHICPY